MTRRRKSRPADIASEQTLARAVRFDVALFLGTGRYATASAATLEATKVEAARPAAENPGSRCPMIYGITTEGGPVGSGRRRANATRGGPLVYCSRWSSLRRRARPDGVAPSTIPDRPPRL